MTKKKIQKIDGANMDIDFSKASWKQGKCPWGAEHKCAIKGVSICDYFGGIVDWDTVLCHYPEKLKNK